MSTERAVDGVFVERLTRLLAAEHEVTLVDTDGANADRSEGDPPGLRRLSADLSRLPPIAFSCEDHARSAAALLAIEEAFGDTPPDYLEVPDYRGRGLVPLQARGAGHRSLRGCPVAVRLYGAAEMIRMLDGTWTQPENRILFDFEREVLRLADLVIWPGGDVLDLYRRGLGTAGFEEAEEIGLPGERSESVSAPRPAARAPGPLRMLYSDALQRSKGVIPLLDACMGLDASEWSLTLIGADTDTAPVGGSMRDTIETMCAGDPRIAVGDPVSAEELGGMLPEHDLLVVPSQFEVWSDVALRAMGVGLPVLATPIGGLTEIVDPGVTGWLTEGTDPLAIRRGLERVLGDCEALERVRASGEIFRRFERLTAEEPILAGYRSLLARLRRQVSVAGPTGRSEPLVSGIVTYYGEHERVGDAVRSLLEQSHRNLEVTIVNDGSFEPEDSVLGELAEDDRVRVISQVNRGEQSARNLGAIAADGDYVAMLDADNTLEPEFVERAVAMLEADPALPYVTCWLRYVDEAGEALEGAGRSGYSPLGNGVRSDDAINSDGDTIAVLPRRLFAKLGYRYEEAGGMASDWELYRVLRDDGRLGAVIPELLARYRVRDSSLSRSFSGSHHSRSWGEALSRRQARKLRWVVGT